MLYNDQSYPTYFPIKLLSATKHFQMTHDSDRFIPSPKYKISHSSLFFSFGGLVLKDDFKSKHYDCTGLLGGNSNDITIEFERLVD